jgi:hypothetical protein
MSLPLTDMTIRIAKPKEKLYKMFDGDGLYLLVAPLKEIGSTKSRGGRRGEVVPFG